MEFLNRNYKNFDSLADNVVTSIEDRSDGTAILSALVKEAKRTSLKPKEVERLVESVNMQLTLDHLKTAGDKRTTFPVVSKDAALSMTHGIKAQSTEETAVSKTASTMQFTAENKLPNVPAVDLMQLFKLEKQASSQVEPKACGVLFKLDHAYKSAKQDVLASTEKIAALYDDLLSIFSQYRAPDFPQFSAKVATLHGRRGEVLCDALAKDTGLPRATVKIASVVDDTSAEMVKAAAFLQEYDTCVRLRQECSDALNRLTEFREEAWREFRTKY